MQVKSIAECSKGSILLYFQPSFSYHLSLRYLFCLFLSGRFRQVLLFTHCKIMLKLTLKEMTAELTLSFLLKQFKANITPLINVIYICILINAVVILRTNTVEKKMFLKAVERLHQHQGQCSCHQVWCKVTFIFKVQ